MAKANIPDAPTVPETPKFKSRGPLPSWRYHETQEPRIVGTPEEHDACEADGWADTPAAFGKETAPAKK